jgi:hypothetical protein
MIFLNKYGAVPESLLPFKLGSTMYAGNENAFYANAASRRCQPTSKTAPLPTPKSEPPPTRSGASFPDWFRLGCAGGASVCSWFGWLVALVVVCH